MRDGRWCTLGISSFDSVLHVLRHFNEKNIYLEHLTKVILWQLYTHTCEVRSPKLKLEQEFQRLTLCGCFAPQTLGNPVSTKVLCNGAYKGPRSRNHSLSPCTLLAQTMTGSVYRAGFSLEFKNESHVLF